VGRCSDLGSALAMQGLVCARVVARRGHPRGQRWKGAAAVWFFLLLAVVPQFRLVDHAPHTLVLPPRGQAATWRCRRTSILQRAAEAEAADSVEAVADTPKRPLEEFQEGMIVDGTVANKNSYGVFIDIGCAKQAILSGRMRLCQKLNRQEKLTGLNISRVDLEKEQLTVTFDGLEALVADRKSPARPKKKKNMTGGNVTTKAVKDAGEGVADAVPIIRLSVNAKDVGPNFKMYLDVPGLHIDNVDFGSGRIELSLADGGAAVSGVEAVGQGSAEKPQRNIAAFKGIEPGSILKGTMKVKNIYGAWADVGLGEDVKLNVSQEVAKKLRWGEELPELRVDSVNHETVRALASFADAEAFVAGRDDKVTKLEELVVGAVVAGHVATRNKYGTFIDFGSETEALLSVRKFNATEAPLGKRLEGLIIKSVDLEKRRVRLGLPPKVSAAPEV